jgi:preprotein translocase subunit SecG
MYSIILVFHIIACLALILIVLLQKGKGSGIAGLFGGGGADQVFSAPSGTAFIKKLTAIMAAIFVMTSLILTIMTSRQGLKTVTGQAFPVQSPPVAQSPSQLPTTPVQK